VTVPRTAVGGSGGRARPLPPEQRRAALIAATQPLLAQHGTKVTTRQIAQAAGVAEGTIFRVFPDKEALINSAVEAALDPASVLDDLARVDPGLPLPERLTQIVQILHRRLVTVFNLLINTGRHGPPPAPGDVGKPGGPGKLRDARDRKRRDNEVINQAVLRLLEPDRDQFRMPVEEVARVLRLLTFAGSHPLINDGKPLAAEQVASILLDGVRQPC